MANNHSIEAIMNVTMENLKAMVDADTIIGSPLNFGEVTLIPVSKVSFGLATGGADFPSKNPNTVFGGGGGAGVTVTPIAFLSVSGTDVKLLQVNAEITPAEKLINQAPELIKKVKEIFGKKTVIEESEI